METMKHYNHALTLAFEVVSTNPSGPSIEEAMPALLRRVADLLLDRQEAREALLSEAPFDTYEMEEPYFCGYEECDMEPCTKGHPSLEEVALMHEFDQDEEPRTCIKCGLSESDIRDYDHCTGSEHE